MTARKKKITKAPANTGTLQLWRERSKAPAKIAVSIRDFEKIYVHHLDQKGWAKTEIAGKLSLTVAQVTHILKTPVKEMHVTGLELDLAFRKLSAKKLILAEECLDAITQEDIDGASLMQKATTSAMLTDKSVQMDKHIRGTKDTTGTIVTAQTREELDSELTKLQEKLGIIQDADFEVLDTEGEDVTTGRTHRRVDPDQHDLFARNPENPEEGGPTRQPVPKEPAGKEIAPGVILRKKPGGAHAS